MVVLETPQADSRSLEPTSSPRISFSAEFLDDNNFISISPNSPIIKREIVLESENKAHHHHRHNNHQQSKARNPEFEFLSNNSIASHNNMITADELFFEGKLLPFWQMQHVENKLNKLNLGTKDSEGQQEQQEEKDGGRGRRKMKTSSALPPLFPLRKGGRLESLAGVVGFLLFFIIFLKMHAFL
ncbi:hypothetical protein G4B88_008365 [Cannabis sativa]|uniref:Uncharacterized protein n=1 Tax=Cannabis sativa TaxID=3483 RepID=A0A7J6G7C5_CANSA|nr:hypothetical protein G4B88_008365 [Cannabis sativa]